VESTVPLVQARVDATFAGADCEVRYVVESHRRLIWLGDGEVRRDWCRVNLFARVNPEITNLVLSAGLPQGSLDAPEVERQIEVACGRLADQVSRLSRSVNAKDWRGQVVFEPGPAGTLIHETIGHIAEADNVRDFGLLEGGAISGLESGLVVLDAGSVPGSTGEQLDDAGRAMAAAVIFERGRHVALLGATPDDERLGLAALPRARRADGRVDALPRMTKLIGTFEGTIIPKDDWQALDRAPAVVHEILWAKVDLRSRRVELNVGEITLDFGTPDERRVFGGRISAPIDTLLSGIVAAGDRVETHAGLCDKRRQRVYVETQAPALVHRDLVITAAGAM